MPGKEPLDYRELHSTEDNPHAADLLSVSRERRDRPEADRSSAILQGIGQKALKVLHTLDDVFDMKGRQFPK